MFTDKGPVVFDTAITLLSLTSSSIFSQLVQAQMAFGSYEVSVIQRTPIPNFIGFDGQQLSKLSHSVIYFKKSLDMTEETSHIFVVPSLLQISGDSLSKQNEIWAKRVNETKEKIVRLQRHINEIAYRLYVIDQKDQQVVQPSLDIEATTKDEEEESSEEERALATDTRSQVTDLVSYIFGTALVLGHN